MLLTAKPVVYLINLSEKDYIRQKNKHLPKVMEWIKANAAGDPIIPISVSFEERLTRFETEAEAEEECKKLGTKSALPKVITTMRSALNLGSFFTTGADEVRQWTIRKGTKAPQAAGVIHTGEILLTSMALHSVADCKCRLRKDLHPVYRVQLRDIKGIRRRTCSQSGW
jgi:obg-like ATPase 1